MKLLLAIAFGGAVGALGRHFVGTWMAAWLGHGFPWGTFVVNVAGAFALGVLIETMALVWSPPAEVRALLAVGLLGAFTTFSAFALDVAVLQQRGELGLALAYVAGSVVGAIGALYLGLRLARLALA